MTQPYNAPRTNTPTPEEVLNRVIQTLMDLQHKPLGKLDYENGETRFGTARQFADYLETRHTQILGAGDSYGNT